MNHTQPVPAVWMSGFPDDVQIPPGAFFYLTNQADEPNAALGFMCPCGCGTEGCVPLKTAPTNDRAGCSTEIRRSRRSRRVFGALTAVGGTAS